MVVCLYFVLLMVSSRTRGLVLTERKIIPVGEKSRQIVVVSPEAMQYLCSDSPGAVRTIDAL